MAADFDTVSACPPFREEMAERYCMHWLPRRDADSFERHLLSCPKCRTAVEDFHIFLQNLLAAVRNAA